MRLQKFMAHSGVDSRRKCEEYICQGRVKVNNKIITELGTEVDPEKDKVYFDSKRIKLIIKNTYVILNKPLGYVSTVSDEKNRKTVIDLIDTEKRLYPIGRLDIDTTGLLLLTDDGSLAQKLTHPSNKISKTYIATVNGTPTKRGLEYLRKGATIKGYKCAPAKVKILKSFEDDSIVEIEIHEGKNHQVKNMFEKIGNQVKKLKRIKMGPIELLDLEIGNYRYLTENEVKELKKL